LAGVDAQFVALKTLIGAGELPAIKCTSGLCFAWLGYQILLLFFGRLLFLWSKTIGWQRELAL
jgi:hypothetical protein